MSIICAKCGAEIENGVTVCPKCNFNLSQDTTITISLVKEKDREETISVQPAEKPQLVVVKGPNIGENFVLSGNEITLGRDPDSDIFLNDITVSRDHAIIAVKELKCVLKDAGSLNGTYVNGVRLDEAELNHGDYLQIGRYKLLFVGGVNN